jgi:hypothetical protein
LGFVGSGCRYVFGCRGARAAGMMASQTTTVEAGMWAGSADGYVAVM